MVTRSILLAGAVPYPQGLSPDPEGMVERMGNQLAGRRLDVPGSPAGAVKYPVKQKLDALKEELQTAARSLSDNGARVLFDLLTKPSRVYELESAVPDVRSLVCLGSLIADEADAPEVIVVRLQVPRGKGPWQSARLAVSSIGADDPVLVSVLEEIALGVVTDQRTYPDPEMPDPTRVLWVGGSAEEVGQAGDWTRTSRGRSRCARVLDEGHAGALRHHAETVAEVSSHTGAPILVWTPFAAAPSAYATGGSADSSFPIVSQGFDEALVELRQQLDRLADDEDVSADREVEDDLAPELGEQRFYKKHFARRQGGDKMLEWKDCGHNRWTSSTNAPQAELGILKRVPGDSLPKLEKCLSCTGGGVWRVTF